MSIGFYLLCDQNIYINIYIYIKKKFFLEFLCFLIGVRAEESVAVSDWHGRSQLKFERDFDLEFSVD